MALIEKDAPLRRAFNAVKDYPWKDRARRLIYDTPIEVAIGALLVGSLLGGGSYMLQREKEGQIPVAFSEVGKTIQMYERNGQPVPPLTKFYASNNDLAMQVFEASNNAFEISRTDRDFAKKLEERLDPALKIHKQIPEYVAEMPANTGNALASLDKLVQAERDLPALVNALRAVWGERHRDVTHTEWYTTESCDSEGKCTTSWHTREVYDYTIHTYTYNKQAGENAARMLNAFVERHPDLNIAERLVLATKTHPDNIEAITRSMKELLKGNIPSEQQALELANTWATGSSFTAFLPQVYGGHAGVVQETPRWDNAKKTAKSVEYRTYRHSDAGPAEYQVIERALNSAVNTLNSSLAITNGIRVAEGQAQRLEQQALEFVEVAQGEKPGNAGKLRSSLMDTAREIYNNNFKRGFDVQPFKAWVVAIWAVAGTLLGGLAGFGVDRFVDSQKHFWEHRRRERERERERNRRRGIPESLQPVRESGLRKKLKDLFGRKAKKDVTILPDPEVALDEAARKQRQLDELKGILAPQEQPANRSEAAPQAEKKPAAEEKPAPVIVAEPAPQQTPVNDDKPRKKEEINPRLRKGGFGL